LQVSYGSHSTVRGVALVSAAPGVYTLDRSGQGPAAVLNQDNTVNSPSAPADRGSIIQIFATGLGDAAPQVTIGEATATVMYSGPAPAASDGLSQVNVLIPQEAQAGDAIPLFLSVGPHRTQPGVTIAVR
jgi:uncharacterized protein (TIGR03437 family)